MKNPAAKQFFPLQHQIKIVFAVILTFFGKFPFFGNFHQNFHNFHKTKEKQREPTVFNFFHHVPAGTCWVCIFSLFRVQPVEKTMEKTQQQQGNFEVLFHFATLL